MPLISSNWKITHDAGGTPYVLLAVGDLLDEEMAVPWTQKTAVSRPMRGTAAKAFGRGAVEHGISFAVFKDHATHHAARTWLLAWAAAVPKTAKSMKFEVSGTTTYYTLSDAVIASGDGRIVTGTGAIRTRVEYRIIGGTFTATTPAPP